ncbi:MAG: dipeptidyl aminopeptidase/acylaminoacyl peptidase [Planctomycetota bacterium]|jgi:dipeptidyl aminopeptidase/acylaminoacyl peptidase
MLRLIGLALPALLGALPIPQEQAPNPAPEISLEQIMSDPIWMGRFPESPYWGPDSNTAYYFRKNPEDGQRDLHSVETTTGRGRAIQEWSRGSAPAAKAVYNLDRTRILEVRNGDIFLTDTLGETTIQLTRTSANESSPQFLLDGDRIAFRRSGTQFTRDLASGLESEAVILLYEEDPEEVDEDLDHLEEQQARLFKSLRDRKRRREQGRLREREGRESDPTRVAPPFYLDPEHRTSGFSLSPNGRHLLLRTVNDSPAASKVDIMPKYVTESSWVETQELRPHVGMRKAWSETLMVLDLEAHERFNLDLSVLPGIQVPVEQESESESESETETPPKAVYVIENRWSPDGSELIIMLRSADNKDRWIARFDHVTGSLVPIHHLHDEAWIGWKFNEFGWFRDGSGIWFVSEESGFAQLYVWSMTDNEIRPLTHGEFEIDQIELNPAGDALYFRANPDDPGIHEICRFQLPGGPFEVVTQLGGRTSGSLSPDGTKLLLTHSKALLPPELYVQLLEPEAVAKRLTFSSTNHFNSFDWIEPEFVQFKASDGQTVHARFYSSPQEDETLRPAVLFVHGAGYLQNAHRGWSGYFREFMFHSFLVQEGYVVIDIDYRASAGYGRDWRTAVYRNMGPGELGDQFAALDWLVLNRNVNPDRIGIYGGSYGGFLTLMALFTQPGLYACGAALRPVTDWSHYNHGYTSNILNTPQEDPDAFTQSSPIEFADGLEDPLLICHGMLDDNVLVKDSIRLAQRLIELEKQNFELALYPMEAHGFREPSSWLDEYRRIYKLFETHLK